MTAGARIKAFERLGLELRMILDKGLNARTQAVFGDILQRTEAANAWFTESNVRFRLAGIAENLKPEILTKWLGGYELPDGFSDKTVYVISAGNIPAAGFEDMHHVLLAGHKFRGKLSGDDKILLKFIAGELNRLSPELGERIEFADGRMERADAVMATGSNNSSRYFEYYFSAYPHVIRKNRNSVAVFSGDETEAELAACGEDLFRYFGLGCRNVTKVFVPKGYSFNRFFESVYNWGAELMQNRKYMNNYEYNRTIYMLNSEKLLDNNFLIVKPDSGIASPPGVLFFEEYDDIKEVKQRLESEKDNVQCVVSKLISGSVDFGQAQEPAPWDYADGFDTMNFLLKL